MARFDELETAFDDLKLKVVNAMDEIKELTDQVLNDTSDQAKVDELTQKISALATQVKDATDPAPTQDPPITNVPTAGV